MKDIIVERVQEELEEHDGASKGKYSIGLGQDCLAFCTDLEDVISMRCHISPSPLHQIVTRG